MPAIRNWSTYQLTEFLGAVSSMRRAEDVAGSGIQRIAEALDAEIGAFVGNARVVCSIGFPFGQIPEPTVCEAIASGSGPLDVPGVGQGHSLVVPIEDEELTSLLLVRLGDDPFTREEVTLVAGMVRVLELVLENIRAFEVERSVRSSLQERQSLLESLARIERSISLRAPLADVLDAITQGAAELFGDEVVGLRLLDPDDPEHLRLVSSRGLTPESERALQRRAKTSSVGGQAFIQKRLVIVEEYEDSRFGGADADPRQFQAAMAAPVREDGHVVGSLTVATYRRGRTYSSSEQEILEALAEHASLALTDARMIEAMRTAELEKDAVLKDLQAGIEEREQLERQLRQAQKMDAIGQLAGGIAHDFNNLLMIILSYSELLNESLGDDDSRRESVLEVTGAAERAAALTHQLLAFSRQEVIRPQTVDLNEVVPNLLTLLRRTLRESIELELELEPNLWKTTIDKSQLEQVLMNLAVNAGDAMPRGGTLRVETANRTVSDREAKLHPGLAAGEYVRLLVTDTGEGMSPDVVSRAFEPFYTTKPRGSGTGLGLATVYGIIKQANGYVSLSSEPGRGTTATVYLHAAGEESDDEPLQEPHAKPATGGETILVVEDEDSVRTLVERLLERSGYRVLSARSGIEALETAAAYDGEINLALTDVVMPGMSGREFADQMTTAKPNIKIVYMSGYPDHVAEELGVLSPGTNYLQKPFKATAMLDTLAHVLQLPTAAKATASAKRPPRPTLTATPVPNTRS